MSCNDLEDIIEKFNSFTQEPAKFLTVQEDIKDDIKNLVKSLYDFTKAQDNTAKKSKTSTLNELIVNDFDEEQIWQQIELQNTECWDNLVWDVASSITANTDLQFPVKFAEDSIENSEAENDENAVANNEELSDTDNDDCEDGKEKPIKSKEKKQRIKAKSSIVDDQFFKLQDMEKFLLNEEKNDGKKTVNSDEESIDMFDEIDSEGLDEDEDGKDAMYSGFFENNVSEDGDDDNEEAENEKIPYKKPSKKGKNVTFADAGSESEGDDNDDEDEEMSVDEETEKPKNVISEDKPDEKKSQFQLRQERLQDQISRLEGKSLSEAPWQLKGEVDATRRPANSLLQEVVDFDLTTRPPPIITEQTTLTLEDIIKQRIKDKAWDDVVKKEKPTDDILAFKKAEILDQAKSKQSLAEVYEAEYLKQKHASNNDNEDEKEPESHKEIREAMSSLFSKLDALSHYHYTPKPAQPEVKIISNTPAITMEEVAPVIASSAALLAPEEVKSKRLGELMSKDERTDTDKKRERRKKKKFQKEKGKTAKVTEHRNTTKATESSNDKSLKTSKAFFQQLNDDTTSVIKSNNAKRKHVKNKGQ